MVGASQAYAHVDAIRSIRSAVRGRLVPTATTLLSPFDPVVWDRSRAKQMFGFHYRIEVYTPGPQRQFGYFTLPILHRDQIVGRLDAKAHRSAGLFEVRTIHLEDGVAVDGDLVAGLAHALVSCAQWHGTPEIQIRPSHPARARSRACRLHPSEFSRRPKWTQLKARLPRVARISTRAVQDASGHIG